MPLCRAGGRQAFVPEVQKKPLYKMPQSLSTEYIRELPSTNLSHATAGGAEKSEGKLDSKTIPN